MDNTLSNSLNHAAADGPDGGNGDILLEVRNLKKYYPLRGGIFSRIQGWIKAVDDVSFDVYRGETLGLVGESGCGKDHHGQMHLEVGAAYFRLCGF